MQSGMVRSTTGNWGCYGLFRLSQRIRAAGTIHLHDVHASHVSQGVCSVCKRENSLQLACFPTVYFQMFLSRLFFFNYYYYINSSYPTVGEQQNVA